MSGYATLGFLVTSGAFARCSTCTANTVVTFVSKLSADGRRLIHSTVLGGNNFAQPTDLAVDKNGNALVSGWTGASDFPTKNGQPIAQPNANYPTTSNAYEQSSKGGGAFLAELSAGGSSLLYATLVGDPTWSP